MIAEILVAALVVIGSVFTLIGSFGLARLPDFYARLHGPTKATTLGVGALISASTIHLSMQGGGLYLHEVLIILFLFLTAPVSAHLVARAALVRRVQSVTAGDDEGDGHRRPDDEPGAELPQRRETRPSPEPPEEE
jgi:multicomponent K+:H+ antiporter subunit G